MNIHGYRFLLSEKSALLKLIDRTPTDRVITRKSLERRLARVEDELEKYEGVSPRLVEASLTFRGKPVVGSRGIDSDFGPDATRSFSKAVDLVRAGLNKILSPTGRVPNREEHRLLIVGTVPGSFGFQLEESSQQLALEGEPSPMEMAIAKVKEVLEASTGTDEELGDAITEIDGRAIRAIQDFLKTVADNEAICALSYRGDVFGFKNVSQVRRSENRLSQDNIKEDEATLRGKFLGFFPHHPRAQFEISGVGADFLNEEIGRIITARVETSVADSVDINGNLNRDLTVGVHTRRVGSGRPRFVITSCEVE